MTRIDTESVVRRPLSHILGSLSHVRLLRSLLWHGGYVSASDLTRSTGLSRESVRQGLATLEALGAVAAVGSAYARVFRFDENGALAPQLAALFMAEKSRFETILDTIRLAARELKPLSLFLYGSAARGEDGIDSDLDICTILPAGRLAAGVEHLREGLRDPSQRLGFVPAVVGLDLSRVRHLSATSDPWWISAVRDALLLDGRRPDDLDDRREARHGQNGSHKAEG